MSHAWLLLTPVNFLSYPAWWLCVIWPPHSYPIVGPNCGQVYIPCTDKPYLILDSQQWLLLIIYTANTLRPDQNSRNFKSIWMTISSSILTKFSLNFIFELPLVIHRQTSNISQTSVGNEIVDYSDVIGASPVGAAATTSFSTACHQPTSHYLNWCWQSSLVRYGITRQQWSRFYH